MSPLRPDLDPEYVSVRSGFIEDLRPYIEGNIFYIEDLVTEDDNRKLREWAFKVCTAFCGMLILVGFIIGIYLLINKFM